MQKHAETLDSIADKRYKKLINILKQNMFLLVDNSSHRKLMQNGSMVLSSLMLLSSFGHLQQRVSGKHQ